MADSTDRESSIARLREAIQNISTAMLITVAHDGSLHSRPMVAQQAEFDGILWFFTGRDTAKAEEVAEHRTVNVSYADPTDNRYVSISGTAAVVRDPGKAKQLWNPAYRAWFPDGLADPRLVLLRVDVEQAEWWDPASNRMVALAGFVRARATGQRFSAGDHEKITQDTSGN